jgi:hypothetical protein
MALYDTPGLFYDSGVFYDVAAPPPERKRMAKVKIGLKNPSREEVADKLNTVKTAMTGNAAFPTHNPPLATLTSQEATIRAKIAAIETAKANLQTAVADGPLI